MEKWQKGITKEDNFKSQQRGINKNDKTPSEKYCYQSN